MNLEYWNSTSGSPQYPLRQEAIFGQEEDRRLFLDTPAASWLKTDHAGNRAAARHMVIPLSDRFPPLTLLEMMSSEFQP
jgi:hypothetical protein